MYATLDDLKLKLSDDELLRISDDQDTGSIDMAVIDAAIEAAGIEVDSYLGERYTLPLDPVPGIVANLAKDIAIYNLYSINLEGPPEHWSKRYDNAVKLLQRIKNGDISLGAADPDSGSADRPRFSSSSRIFSRSKMKGY